MAKSNLKRRAKREPKNGNLSGRLVTIEDPTGAASEAYHTLRASLVYALMTAHAKVITLTSPNPGEGTSTTCANLGVSLAQAGNNTLIMDCDLRRPVLHRLFGLPPNSHGLVDASVGKQGLQEILQAPLPNLKVAPAGSIPDNPVEFLSSRSFADLVEQARQKFDYVLIDSSSMLSSADPLILAAQADGVADGVLLVMDVQSARKDALSQALRTLESVGANVLGTVANNVKVSKRVRSRR